MTVICLLLCGTKAAVASDWSVTYSPSVTTASDNGVATSNSSVTKTKTLTITATLHWQGNGIRPSRILVVENAGVTWKASVNSFLPPPGDPSPGAPGGTMIGSASTGLTEVVTKIPDPQTAYATGEQRVGTRETIVTVPAAGDIVLPPVTLTATATVTTGNGGKGNVTVSLDGYTASVPDASAHSSAGFTISPDATLSPGWTIGPIEYTDVPAANATFDVNTGPASFPGLNVHLEGVGLSANLAVTAKQYYQYTGSGTAPDLVLSGSYFISGDVSLARFSAASSAHYALGEPENDLSGSAPNAQTGLQYSKRASFNVSIGSSPSSPQVVAFLLKASASTQ